MLYTTFFSLPIKNKKIQKIQEVQEAQKQISFLTSIEYKPTYFLYITIERFIYSQGNINKVNALYGNHRLLNNIYISWVNLIGKVVPSQVSLDSMIIYFTSLFILKSNIGQHNESNSIKYFNSFNFFYINGFKDMKRLYPTSKQEQYFYTKVIDILTISDFFGILNENNLVLFNKVTQPSSSLFIKIKSKRKVAEKHLVSSAFISIIKRFANTNKKYKIKIKLKRLIRFFGKLKQVYSNHLNLPYAYNFTNKSNKSGNSKQQKVQGKKLFSKEGSRDTLSKKSKLAYKHTLNKVQSFKYRIVPTQFNEAYTYSNITEQVKTIISLLTHSHFSFYKLNALSITRFQFEIDRIKELKKNPIIIKKRKSGEFLSQLEQKIEARYRYIAIYVKDLVRITFFCIYLKKAEFIANFYAFILSKLPRKRKETKLISFFVRILKVFSAQRLERIAVRLRFQGRLNR